MGRDHLKHPDKIKLDLAESAALDMLEILEQEGVRISTTNNEFETLYLCILGAPSGSRRRMEVDYSVRGGFARAATELVFLDAEGGDERASLFVVEWDQRAGTVARLDTMGDGIPVSEQARAFAREFKLSRKGEELLLTGKGDDWQRVLRRMAAELREKR